MKKILLLGVILVITSLLLVGCGKEPVTDEQSDQNVPEEAVASPETISENTETQPEVPVEVIPEEPAIVEEVTPAETATTTPTIHEVQITVKEFSPKTIDVKVGDLIRWTNARSGNLKQAIVIGNRQCVNMKSGILLPGDTFEWTFDQAQQCTVIDGITTTQTMVINVE